MSHGHSPVCIDVKLHPTDLNLLLVAYEGGVSLWNIAEKRAELNWECEQKVGPLLTVIADTVISS